MEVNLNIKIIFKSKFDYPNHFAGESANGTEAESSRLNVTQGSKKILAIGRKTQFDVRSAALIGQGLF